VSRTQAILSVKYTPVGIRGGINRSVGGLGRYIQYRDNRRPDEQVHDVDGMTRYVSYRDRAAPEGRLFDADGTIGDKERRELTQYVTRSVADETRRYREGDWRAGRQRAVYRFVLSPADARGLDLREVTRETMKQLGRDAGPGDLRWIAAEHRNTQHPHVHIILAARRERQPGQFRTLQITKPRLERMKATLDHQMSLQHKRSNREQQHIGQALTRSSERLGAIRSDRAISPDRHREAMNDLRDSLGIPRQRSDDHAIGLSRLSSGIGRIAGRLARYYQREMQRAVREGMKRGESDERINEVTHQRSRGWGRGD
jgi:hypothetical protein